ncbi:MAG: [citrate (pro-3S)-lyase] ligase [Bacteroidales bacterium]|nr:[citrate (pro-3S)-lyase] ligase [Bacteroidales bacterium]
MYSDYEIRQLPLSVRSNRQAVSVFLAANGLRLDAVDYYAAVYACGEEEMLAGGGLCGDVIKCIAVSPKVRDEGMANRLVSHLISVAMGEGHTSVKLFTKPENRAMFESLGFSLIAQSPEAIFMENGGRGLSAYCQYLRTLRDEASPETHGESGAIVMNANPFTRGHRYLIEQAAAQVSHLYIIAVKEDKSQFGYTERISMMRDGCRGIRNVTVCEGSDYAVSASTFPTYFLKKIDAATDAHITLDLDLFARRIAPALGATVRFVGTEPADGLTARYNRLMKEQLPPKGVRVVEIERLCEGDAVISASAVRQSLAGGSLQEAARMVYPTTVPYLISSLASAALQKEVDTTPKPGLVDRKDSGAHRDMDHGLMTKSIRTLHPFFTQLAALGLREELPAVEKVRATGMEAEKAMLQATGGVNTHKGALFSFGLMAVAAAFLLHNQGKTDAVQLRDAVSVLASQFPKPQGTHGSHVSGQYAVKGALANACDGYPQLFDDWLPFYRQCAGDEFALHKTLLHIMSALDDTNIYFRKDAGTVRRVKQEAGALLKDFSVEALEEMNRRFIGENISPGGSADMLALTVFIDTLLK